MFSQNSEGSILQGICEIKAEGFKQKGKIQAPEEFQWIISGWNRHKPSVFARHSQSPSRAFASECKPHFCPVHADAQTRLSYRPHAGMAEKIHCKDPLATHLISMACFGRLRLIPAAWAAGRGRMPVAQQRCSQAGSVQNVPRHTAQSNPAQEDHTWESFQA